jgi:hypothetical protein
VGDHRPAIAVLPEHRRREGLIYLDRPDGGGFAAYEDGVSMLELARRHYRDTGLDARQLDRLIR